MKWLIEIWENIPSLISNNFFNHTGVLGDRLHNREENKAAASIFASDKTEIQVRINSLCEHEFQIPITNLLNAEDVFP